MENYNGAPRVPITEKPPALSTEGFHIARCVGIVQLGNISIAQSLQRQEQVRITFELPFDRRQFDPQSHILRPKLLSKEYASRLYGKSWLKKHLINWMGEGFVNRLGETMDPFQIIGEPCQIYIVHSRNPHSGKWFEDIRDIIPVNEGQCPAQENESKVLVFSAWDERLFQSLPDFVKNKIMGSTEYATMKGRYNDGPHAG